VDRTAYRAAARLGGWTTVIAGAALAVTGDLQGKVMTEVQPMKMAAAEALYGTAQPAGLSVFTVGTLDGSRELYALTVPRLLSFLGTGSFGGRVQGIDDLQAQYTAAYGPGSYAPAVPVTYWSFRLMIGLGVLAVLVALWGLWSLRGGRTPTSRWLPRAALALPVLPLAANALGWVFTEMGRQPWLVFGQLRTADGVSPGVSAAALATSLIVFTLLYAALAVVEVRLLLRFARAGLPDLSPPPEPADEPALSFSY
jgi:cytochrome d ubiquinol oxidase subunit I